MFRLGILLAAAILTGCSTQYGRSDILGLNGYQDRKVSEDRYVIQLSCNDYTSDEKCEAMLRYRAAEITLTNSYDHFIFVNGKPKFNSMLTLKYDFEEEVTLGRGEKPSQNPWAFNAKEVLKNLEFIVKG